MRPVLVLSGLVAALLLSGCTASNGADGQKATAPGSIAYNGASTGTDQARPIQCSGPAQVHVTSNIGSGKVTITVKDGSGRAVYAKVLEGPGQDGESKSVSGAGGSWTMTGVRASGSFGAGSYGGEYAGGFSGQYAAHIEC